MRVFLNKPLDIDTRDDVQGIERVAFALTHLLAFGITHEAVDVHVLKRDTVGKVLGHHNHSGNPEEDDVVASHKNRTRKVQIVSNLFVAFGIRPP